MKQIYHLAWRSDWDRLARAGEYRADSLATEGFIHATAEPDWVERVADLFFPRRDEELLLITINEEKLGAPVRYEDPGNGHLFPHIYGPIELDAVQSIERVRWTADGWKLPTARG